MLLVPWLEGFLLGAGLIIAIGAQNAFVLKQGLKRQHLLLTATTCFVCDGFLIALGVSGLGTLIQEAPLLTLILRAAGAIFLMGYGIRSFMNVFRPHTLTVRLGKEKNKHWLATFSALLAFTLLNPHTYIDTLLILGSVGADHSPSEHPSFIFGALTASFLWFYGLTYGATLLTPLFKNPRAWQVLDTIMGFVMFGIAATLIF